MVRIPDKWWCNHNVVSEEESWRVITVECKNCGQRIPWEEWKKSKDGVSE